jgi:hypothetical protein
LKPLTIGLLPLLTDMEAITMERMKEIGFVLKLKQEGVVSIGK